MSDTAMTGTLDASVAAAPTAAPESGTRASGFRGLSRVAQAYVAGVTLWGMVSLLRATLDVNPYQPLFITLLVAACLMSAWKISLPISVANGSTLSLADAANVMSLLLLGAPASAVIAAAGVWVQCTHRPKQKYPLHRTLFSAAVAALTMLGAGAAYNALGGRGVPTEMPAVFAQPVIGGLAAYFLINTGLVAGAIAVTAGRGLLETWQDDFLWSASSFMVAGAAGALGAVVVARAEYWKLALLLAPMYVTYRTYLSFIGRLDSEQRHTLEVRALHEQAIAALRQTREAERALAAEKERLAAALARMTRLEELRQELLGREQASRAAAEAANRVKDQFLAVVSHELRTPLNAILGWADMLCRGKLDAARRERAAVTIRDSARHQAQLIDDLLDVARITSGKLRLHRAIVELKTVVFDALQVVLPVAESKGVRVVAEYSSPVDPLYGDAARLQQVVWNLLSNAVKFTPSGGTVTISLKQVGGDAAELRVEDTGPGIATEFLPIIFEPFRQADASSTRTHRGLGLGLAIVKSLVEAHGGSVSAESLGPGQGASFAVRLPTAGLSASPPLPTPDRKAPDGRSTDVQLAGISVLVVDDELDAREVVAAQIQLAGATVLTATSASDALGLLQRERFDVLISDVGMPGEDGYSLIRRVRALTDSAAASIPAAALTALARKEDRQQALQAGFQLHLTKPVDSATLVTAVARLHRLNTP